MFFNCENCKKDVEPCLDTTTLVDKKVVNETKVICPICKNEIKCTMFTKKMLNDLKQFFTTKPAGAFEFKCMKCKEFQPAILSKDEKQAVCKVCGTVFNNFNPFMIRAMKIVSKKEIQSE